MARSRVEQYRSSATTVASETKKIEQTLLAEQAAALSRAAAAKVKLEQETRNLRPGNFSPPEGFHAQIAETGDLLILEAGGASAALSMPFAKVEEFRSWLNRHYGPDGG